MADELTLDLWKLVLVHVPVRDRLLGAALANPTMSKAAAAVTRAVHVDVDWHDSKGQKQKIARAVKSYLQKHGANVDSIVLPGSLVPTAPLPTPHLLKLTIHGGSVHLGPPSGRPPGVLDICRGLTKLDLSYCEIPTAHSLLNLSALVDLRQMRLGCLHGNATLPGSVFSSMTHMHSMNLARIAVEDVHFVSCLSRLHFMDLCNVNGPPASAQAGAYREPLRLLPSIGGGGIGGGGGGGGFAFPASLREYRQFGECIVLDGSVLAPCTQLTKLVLRRTSLAGVESGGASLLSALAGMQELDTLCCADLSRVNWPAPGSVYTALTRSPKLRVLTLSDCAVPLGAWKHALPAAGLPSLRHLISTADGGYSVSHYWEAEHVSRLASCCPGIESLRLWVRSSPPCAELPAFTALTELDLTVNCQRDEPAAVGVCVEHVAGIFELSWLDLRFLLPGNDDARARYDPETETADDAVWAAAMLPLAEAWGLSFCRVRLQRPWQPLNYARVFLKAGEQYDDFPDSSDEAEFGSDDDGDEGDGYELEICQKLLKQLLRASKGDAAVAALAKKLSVL